MKEWFSQVFENLLEFNPITISVVGCLILGGILLLVLTKSKWTPRMLAMGGISVGLSFVLSFIVLFRMPQGGSVSLASGVPIMMFAWVFGPIAGITAGAVSGLLQLMQGAYIIHPAQFLLDYVFPFAILGIAGFFTKTKVNFIFGVVIANIGRFVMHFLSGVIFWGAYAGEGQSVIEYSLIYNGSYMIPEMLIAVVVMSLLLNTRVSKSMELMKKKNI